MTEVAGARELSKDGLLDAYRTMCMIREFEERLHTEFATGEIPGFVHLYAGEEAIAAGFFLIWMRMTISPAPTGATDTPSRRAASRRR